MSSYDKVVKLACKPKAAPPKAKYLDTIIAATWSEDGAVHDVCKALSPRFKEPNAIVVFKALIVLHTMIRNGATDNVLSYLSSSEVLRLRNVSSGNWEGYSAPQNLQNYAIYLDSRIRAYRDLKHDAVRVQAESNRDMRNSQSIEEDGYRGGNARSGKGSSAAPTRSKTIMGRKLRVMTVEKGLLRETKAVHRMIDALLECRFYLDDLEDELIITALRMLVKDLLILFQAGNEGVINVLEHYFEMSHIDAKEALAIYRHFCNQTERVVEYLGVAKKLQNLLNVPIPNLKHAPVSLAGALQEYLDDPNFEQNRLEYRANKETADKGTKANGTSSKPKAEPKAPQPASSSNPPKTDTATPSSNNATTANASSTTTNSQPNVVVDFFTSIEEQQPTMFNPQTQSPNNVYFQQQAVANPFVQMQMTGQPFGMQPSPSLQIQPTGFQQPFASPNPLNPFGLTASQSLQPQLTATPTSSGHRPFSSYIQPQSTGFLMQNQPQQQPNVPPLSSMTQPQLQQPAVTGFLQPQPTGSNPFRQSMIVPQTTGMALFGVAGGGGLNQQPPLPGFPSSFNNSSSSSASFSAFPPSSSVSSPFSQPASAGAMTSSGISVPARPASTPLTAFGSTNAASSSVSPPAAQPVKTHQTGTKNPFGPIVEPPPPVPKQPTLSELAMGKGNTFGNGSVNGVQTTNAPQQQQQQPTQSGTTGQSLSGFNTSALGPGATDISSVASSFAFSKPPSAATGDNKAGSASLQGLQTQDTSTTISTSTFSSSSLFTQPTGTTNTSSAPSAISSTTPFSASSLKPQTTGFAGLKPFKPSSSFGAALLESLPPIPGSDPNTPAVTGAPGGTGVGVGIGVGGSAFSSATTSSSLSSPANTTSSGLSNQMTGLGVLSANAQPSGFGALNSQPTGVLSNTSNPLGSSGFGSGSSLGQGLRPQMTGGAANPFRASMMIGGSSTNVPPVPPLPNGMGPSFLANASSNPGSGRPFGASAFGQNTFNPSAASGFNVGQSQQQQQNASLI